jgi:peptidoglycan hydrolase-like protein with peptidoglycan-binding domain
MAQIDRYIDTFGTVRQLNFITSFMNVSAGVGKNGVNNADDVLLTQALLKAASVVTKGMSESECPEPTGTFDERTEKAIKRFQSKYRGFYSSARLKVDGIVSPAWGGGQLWRRNRLWTIIALNMQAEEVFTTWDGGPSNYIENMIGKWGQLALIFRDIPEVDSEML